MMVAMGPMDRAYLRIRSAAERVKEQFDKIPVKRDRCMRESPSCGNASYLTSPFSYAILFCAAKDAVERIIILALVFL